MKKVKIDFRKLLGFRLVADGNMVLATTGSKTGSKGGVKLGVKRGQKPPSRQDLLTLAGSKIGSKEGGKPA